MFIEIKKSYGRHNAGHCTEISVCIKFPAPVRAYRSENVPNHACVFRRR